MRLALAALSALLVAGSFALMLERSPHARARVTAEAEAQARVAPRAVASLGENATQVQDSVAAQSQQEAIHSWESEHHELPDPQRTPLPHTRVAINQVDRVSRLWLRGYLPYEVDRLTAAAKRDLMAGSTPALAGRLLAGPPLIPPAGPPPVQGRLVALSLDSGSGCAPGPSVCGDWVRA